MQWQRFWRGSGWAILATVAMSVFMLIGLATGMSPMPKPIPAAIIGKLLGTGVPTPVLMGLAVLSHLAYGGLWGGVLAAATKPVTVAKGAALGIALWLIMQVVVLPFLGWGLFGSDITLKIAGATLALHLVYGITYGALMDRQTPPTEDLS